MEFSAEFWAFIGVLTVQLFTFLESRLNKRAKIKILIKKSKIIDDFIQDAKKRNEASDSRELLKKEIRTLSNTVIDANSIENAELIALLNAFKLQSIDAFDNILIQKIEDVEIKAVQLDLDLYFKNIFIGISAERLGVKNDFFYDISTKVLAPNIQDLLSKLSLKRSESLKNGELLESFKTLVLDFIKHVLSKIVEYYRNNLI